MGITVAEFRASFPQFGEEQFPDGRVTFWIGLAAKQLAEDRWDELWPEGVCLYAAHHLTLERAATLSSDGTGGMQAAAGAVVSKSKSVGSVSTSESRAGAAATGSPEAGHWNDTIYGKQYWQLAKLVGAGGLVV
ncbi:DUF4054 domain-containing protein [Desulfovibrio psychrotolerans]|uniref:DUF4054 domain-containing protein n=1 Tax=Desulfovibrio psychrotolerans TaxID=415242 RepID=A0A7J0BW95_9BACT|nr:DUF4054 domain-containing protein [Desulfovibrio psychrotolerans]GFM37996.1 hypothetical protein DSM19430T_26800 [Desulfovibrio psychrotolerans]